jgi:predicted RNase H-like HicB family nuclease
MMRDGSGPCFPLCYTGSMQLQGDEFVPTTRSYSVILEAMDKGGFLVRVPVLPEVVTCGDTESEALAMARDAVELVLASRLERGESVPEEMTEPRLHRITVALATR